MASKHVLVVAQCAVALSLLGSGFAAKAARIVPPSRPPITNPPPPTVVVTPAVRNGEGQVSPS